MHISDFAARLTSRVSRDYNLTPQEHEAIERLPVRVATVPADQMLVREGDKPSRSEMILEGIACTSKTLASGKRQIMAFHIREDFPDLLSLHLPVMDSDIWALTECKVGFVDHTAIRALCLENPRLAASLWRITLLDAAIFRHWVVNVGQRAAEQRLAHLFCEMMSRMEAIGEADKQTCRLPLTQSDISEATGISTVHVNRSLQSLRGQGLISFHNGTLTIHDRQALEELADFSSTYLHLPQGKLPN